MANSPLPVIDGQELSAEHHREDVVIWAGVLAAGQSSRFGKTNKLLAERAGRPLVQYAIETVDRSSVSGITVVVGHEHEQIRQVLDEYDIGFLTNTEYSTGQSSSVVAAVRAARSHNADAILIMLGDMPAVETRSVNLLVDAYRAGIADILVAGVDDRRGNPVLFDARFFDSLLGISGDTGARDIILESDDAVLLNTADPGVLYDVDYPSDIDG